MLLLVLVFFRIFIFIFDALNTFTSILFFKQMAKTQFTNLTFFMMWYLILVLNQWNFLRPQLTKLEAKEVWSITDILAEIFQQNFSEETDPHTRLSSCQGWATVLGSLTVGLLSARPHTGHLALFIAWSSDPGGYWGQGPQWALSSESWVPRSTPSSTNWKPLSQRNFLFKCGGVVVVNF